jgi:nicotinate-nucleotide adenylyltransferase
VTATRIGLFGGTFDPPHLGHEVVARQSRAILDLDRVLWMVANDPWQKAGQRAPSPASIRFEMVQAAAAELDGQLACSLEIERGGPTYTIDTVTELESRCPGAELVLVLGRDTAAGLPGWHRAEELSHRVGVAYVDRPGSEGLALPVGWNAERLDIPAVAVSSTDVRARFVEGRPLDGLVRSQVVAVAESHGLYPVAG